MRPHPSLAAAQPKLTAGLQLQDGNEICRGDEGLIFRPLVVAKHALIGPLGERIDSRLHRWIEAEFSYSLSGLRIETAAERIEYSIQNRSCDTHK